MSDLLAGQVTVRVKPNAKESRVVGFDEVRGVWRLDIAAPAENNRANVEVVRFLSKLVGSRVSIRSGLTSKEKRIELVGKTS